MVQTNWDRIWEFFQGKFGTKWTFYYSLRLKTKMRKIYTFVQASRIMKISHTQRTDTVGCYFL